MIDAGGTITHHHAVGRDHRPWYDRQRPEPFAEALRAAKRELDPGGDPQPGRADRPLRAAARSPAPRTPNLPRSIMVGHDQGTAQTGRARGAVLAPTARPRKPRRGPVRAAIVAMRPQEWVKNLLVFAGLLFSGQFDETRRGRRRDRHLRRLLHGRLGRLPGQRRPRRRARTASIRPSASARSRRGSSASRRAITLAVVLTVVGARRARPLLEGLEVGGLVLAYGVGHHALLLRAQDTR